MAKKIIYYIATNINLGTDKNPEWHDFVVPVTLDWSESNEEIAIREAHNGEYTVEDDGKTEESLTHDERISELEEALELILSGATE